MDGMSDSNTEAGRVLLRHTLATLAYRGGKAVTGAPDTFGAFRGGTRTPLEILSHVGDLMDWALSLANGKHVWRDATPLDWNEEVARFFNAMKALDERLASSEPLGYAAEKLFQGPIADALTHVGQLNMLRRLAGSPVRGENFFRAEIIVGLVGPEQSTNRVEFD